MTTINFPHHPLFAQPDIARNEASSLADVVAGPVAVYTRDGWFTFSEIAPDDDIWARDPESLGWHIVALFDGAMDWTS